MCELSRNIAECVQNVSVCVTVSGIGLLCFDLFIRAMSFGAWWATKKTDNNRHSYTLMEDKLL